MISLDASGRQRGDQVANLAVGVVAGGVEQRGGQLDFQGFGALDQVDEPELSAMGMVGQEFGGGLGQFGAGLDLVFVGLGVFDQGGSGADLAGEQLGGFGGQSRDRRLASFSTKAAPAWALTFQAGPVAASRSLTPRSRTSAAGWESRRETWVSRVRALTIWPREVLVASGSR